MPVNKKGKIKGGYPKTLQAAKGSPIKPGMQGSMTHLGNVTLSKADLGETQSYKK